MSAGYELKKFKAGGDTAAKALDSDKKVEQLMTVINTLVGLQKKASGLREAMDTAKEETMSADMKDELRVKILELVELQTVELFDGLFRDEVLSDGISHMCCGTSDLLDSSIKKMEKCIGGCCWAQVVESELGRRDGARQRAADR